VLPGRDYGLIRGHMGILSQAKDRVVEQLAVAYLNETLLKPYGRVTQLRIDSTGKTIRLTGELKGESAPVEIEIFDYEIGRDEAGDFVIVKELRTSREWLTELARNHLCGVRFKLPAKISGVLRQAL
jgi:hypothetical protein